MSETTNREGAGREGAGDEERPRNALDHDVMVVGLGASAGGVSALSQFFERMPADSGLAFVVILHLSPQHNSNLIELLQVKTSMPVMQVQEPIKAAANHVYVIPPNKHIIMSDGQIRPVEAEGLEAGISERTHELAETNETLRLEIAERLIAEAQVKALLHQLVKVQEEERRRLSRELHDQLGQQLTALKLKIEFIKSQPDLTADWREQIESLETIASQLDHDVNNLAWELRPSALDDLGLVAALAHYIREWSLQFDVQAEFHSSGLDGRRLSPEAESTIYRTAQEALNNVVKHAAANRASILLERRDQELVLIIEDDGVGFTVSEAKEHQGLGILGMRERVELLGGTIEIESRPEEGTTVYVRAPFPEAQD